MRSFSEFHTQIDEEGEATANEAKLRSMALWAYLLLRPSMEFVRQRSNFILGWQAASTAGGSLSGGVSAGAIGSADRPPLGSWMILPDLTSPATQTVLPSNDALYGAAQVELDRQGPLVLTIPANLDDRYYSVTVMDAHMNNVAHIGPRWTGNDAAHFVLVPYGWTQETPAGVTVIECPTPSLVLYNRMIVEYADGDIDRVRAWQAGLRISPLSAWPDTNAVPAEVEVSDLLHPTINTLTDAREYLRIGFAHLARNPMVRDSRWLTSIVTAADLPSRTAPDEVAAIEAGTDDATSLIDLTLATWPLINGWMQPDTGLGKPNPDVLKSAAFQQFQIGSNDAAEALYYFADVDADGELLDASGDRRYDLTFGADALPPIHPSGYWSITMYGADSLLVANDQARYATRPSRPGSTFNADASFTLTFATHRPSDVPDANWLPAPDGRFRLGLRVYYPILEDIAAGWAPPAVHRQP